MTTPETRTPAPVPGDIYRTAGKATYRVLERLSGFAATEFDVLAVSSGGMFLRLQVTGDHVRTGHKPVTETDRAAVDAFTAREWRQTIQSYTNVGRFPAQGRS